MKYFELIERNTPEPGSGAILTAAVMFCSLCGKVIDGMGGPGYGAVCEPCADIMIRGELRKVIVYEDTDR